jgi:hypothetical protein
MTNMRLRTALMAAKLTVDDVARELMVDPKTVQRWIKGRRPHPRHRWALTSLLHESEEYLWPDGAIASGSGVTCSEEIVAAFAHRADATPTRWWGLLEEAEVHIDLLGYAMLHLPEQHPDLMPLLRSKADNGCSIRLTLVDPLSDEARRRDREEGLDDGLIARIRTSTKYFSELAGSRNIAMRLHSTPMYNSIFRFDDQMLVTPHIFATPGSRAPMLHLRRLRQGGIFDGFVHHFEGVWATSEPVELVA